MNASLKMYPFLFLALLSLTSGLGAIQTIDLAVDIPSPHVCPYGPGTTINPLHQSITLDQRSFLLNGKRWVPVVGEFHYSRYPESEWRDELLKMKANGLNTVSCYVFWIHHEDVQGYWDWSGNKSLRKFVSLCAEVELKVIVRLGPWDHGECRNGGFPDWIKKEDPKFMEAVRNFFTEESAQLKGLLWKNGGPVIGVQLDNENSNGNYLLQLKKLAIETGIDVPFYTITGWQGGVPKAELLPLFGGYTQGFWGGSFGKEYLLTPDRTGHDLGAQGAQVDSPEKIVDQFPYACAEIGGGMMSSHRNRISINPEDISTISLCKLACGNNMPGYYMFQGGFNPDSPLHTLQEDHPNQMPVKNYDFQAPLGMNGEVREHFHFLRELHLFLNEFGSSFAQAIPFLPDIRPASDSDYTTLRWDIRYDGNTGYLFFNNRETNHPFEAHPDVKFSVKTKAATALIPQQPITIPKGSHGFWPFHWNCDGVTLNYATVQPLCRIPNEKGEPVYFFMQIPEIRAELSLNGEKPLLVQPSTSYATSVRKPSGEMVHFVVLSPELAKSLYRVHLAGQDRAILSDAVVAEDGDQLRLFSNSPHLSLSVFPPLENGLILNGKLAPPTEDGIFSQFSGDLPQPISLYVTETKTKSAEPFIPNGTGTDEASWKGAAEYSLSIPTTAANRRIILVLNYQGDAARVYIGDKLIMDDYFNGNPLNIALWRIPKEEWPQLRVLISADKNNRADLNSVEAREQFQGIASAP